MEQCTTMFDCLTMAFSWIDAIDLDWFILAGKCLFVIVPTVLAFAFVGHKLANALPNYPEAVKDFTAFMFCMGVSMLVAYLVGTVFYCVVTVFMGGF